MAKPKPKKRGPKPKYEDPKIIKPLLQAIEDGLTETDACHLVGIDPDTLRRWKAKEEICGAIKSAIARGKHHHIKRIKAGDQGWQSSAWFLERKYRKEFGKDAAPPPPPNVTISFKDDE
jgi:hypothetical protein